MFHFCNIFDLLTSRTQKIAWWPPVFKPDFYIFSYNEQLRENRQVFIVSYLLKLLKALIFYKYLLYNICKNPSLSLCIFWKLHQKYYLLFTHHLNSLVGFLWSYRMWAYLREINIKKTIWKCQYQHWHQHRHSNANVVFTQYKSPLELKVLHIFVEHVIVNKIATYRWETCHFVRKCFWKCFDNLRKAAVQNPCRKHSAVESFLMKLQI